MPAPRYWRDLSVSNKLYFVVGLMAILVAVELFTLMFAMHTLSSVRAFVMGEGLWTKGQKDAVHSLLKYAQSGEERFYIQFKEALKVPNGDHVARMELLKDSPDYKVVREGFLEGGNHAQDVEGMIHLLTRYQWTSYIREAIAAWARADQLLDRLRDLADRLHLVIQTQGRESPEVGNILEELSRTNTKLTAEETYFSNQLGEGSRWLEKLLMVVLLFAVVSVEGTGLFLTFGLSRSLKRSLDDLKFTAEAVRAGDLSVHTPVRSKDELGQVGESLNRMIADLKISIQERERAESALKRLNEDLELRVQSRTKELARRETQVRLITDTLPELVAQLDTEEKFLFANQSFCRWFDRPLDQVIGHSLREILGEQRYPVNKPFVERVLSGEVTTYERHSDAGPFPTYLEITFLPEFDEARNVVGFILVAVDVSKFKRIEEDLRLAKEAADTANATKSAFLANMSHEIRTPLGAILGFSELLASQRMSSLERGNSLEIIKRNGSLLSKIINDILDLSKVEAGKLVIEKMQVSFTDIIAEIQSLLLLEASGKGIRLSFRTEGPIPEFLVTDPMRLRQILTNIVGNAIKFTSRGSVDVTVRMMNSTDSFPRLGFVVKDTGEGIHPDRVRSLFAPFSQADPSTTRRFGGTGLGLVLSRRLAVLLGGDVELIQSVLGQGSTFLISIDPGRMEKVLFENYNGSFEKKDTVRRIDSSHSLANLRILLVDDALDNLKLVERFLVFAGAEVETATTGREAVEKAIIGDHALILMDLQMPEMDGYEATNKLRRRGYNRPIIALTAHAMKEERERCLANGFNEQITKPIDRQALISTVATFATG